MWSVRLLWKVGGVFLGTCVVALVLQLWVGRASASESVGSVLATSLLLGIVAAGLTVWVVWSGRRPVADVIAVAKAMVSGDYAYPLALAQDVEYGDLAKVFA